MGPTVVAPFYDSCAPQAVGRLAQMPARVCPNAPSYHRNDFALSKSLEMGRVSVRHAPIGRKPDNKLARQGRSFEGGALWRLGITAHVLTSWVTRIENYRDFADKPS